MPRTAQPPPPPPPPPPQPPASSTRYSILDPLLFGDPTDKDGDLLSASERYFLSHPASVQSHPFDADSPIMDMPMPMPSDILDDPPLSWELMALGLAEPLPAQEVIDSLYVC